MSVLETALKLAEQGYAVHYLRSRSKVPIAAGWSTAPVATIDKLRATYRTQYNVGVRCGRWSQPVPGQGVIVLDVDIDASVHKTSALDVLENLLPDSLTIPVGLSGSGNGSRHLWFTCPNDTLPPRANITILQGEGWKVEALSTGKQIVVPPSIHPDTGAAYRWLVPLSGPPPIIPQALLQVIQDAARPPKLPYQPPPHRQYDNDDSIADAFRVVSWSDILEPHGWQFVRQQGERLQWCRPGKDPRIGISATTTCDVFYPFTTSTEFEAERGYSKFAVYAILEHGGDMSQAAKVRCAVRSGRAT